MIMKLNLVYYGKDILSQVAEDVKEINDEVLETIESMFKVMYKEKGIGLAAPQVNLDRRIITIDPGDDARHRIALINPVILESSEKTEPYEEGCLSLPNVFAEVERAAEVRVRWTDLDGREEEEQFAGLWATCVQHEIDHLDGKLFIDYLGPLKRQMITRKMEKLKRERARAG